MFLEEGVEGEPKAYLVHYLASPFEELLPIPPPVLVEAVLVPFKGRIVYDGFIVPYTVYFVGRMRRRGQMGPHPLAPV